MSGPIAGGRRRIDRVLGPDFLVGLDTADLDELRAKREDAEQEEVDLSYVRRLIQGRIDIAEAERRRRASGSEGSILDQLVDILTDDNASTTGSGRHLDVEPSRVAEHRRVVERVVSDARISDVSALTDDQLEGALRVLREHEEHASGLRRDVQTVVDTLSDAIGRRMAAQAEAAGLDMNAP
jgi:hypothetical protein